MGRVKHEMHEAESRGWYSVDKFVCSNCIEDSFLQDLIDRNVERSACDYCDRQADVDIAAPVDVLLERLADTLLYHFAEPVDAGVSYESREGGWQADVFPTEEALLEIDFGTPKEDLFADVVAAITTDSWVKASGSHWLGLAVNKEYMYSWETFAHHVKHESRYFFGTSRFTKDDPFLDEHLGYSQTDILTQIGKLCTGLNLMQTIPSGSTFYRARSRKSDSSWPLDAASMGAPPANKCSAGRMNPAGISYLYLADEEATAIAEVVREASTDFAVGTFEASRMLLVLNLADLPEEPSIFDSERRKEREWNLFLQGFVKSITQPVEKDGKEHIDYVPSQVISEYFRLVYQMHPDSSEMSPSTLDGIIYPSATRIDHRNLVLFPVGQGYKRTFDQVSFSGATLRRIAHAKKML